MKMNSPVHCRSFFADQIEHSPERLWCVSLRLNGQIQALIEAKWATEAEKRLTMDSLLRQAFGGKNRQLLVARINPEHLIFDNQDWKNVDAFKKLSSTLQLEFTDYIKINKRGYCSLLTFDH